MLAKVPPKFLSGGRRCSFPSSVMFIRVVVVSASMCIYICLVNPNLSTYKYVWQLDVLSDVLLWTDSWTDSFYF